MKAGNIRRCTVEHLRSTPHLKRNMLTYLGFVTLGRVREIPASRELINEPFDFFMHNGNILSSLNAALAASATLAIVHQWHKTPDTWRTQKIWGISLIAGACVNALVETRSGLSLPITPEVFTDSTPDPIDFWYGIGGAALGATIADDMLPRSSLDGGIEPPAPD